MAIVGPILKQTEALQQSAAEVVEMLHNHLCPDNYPFGRGLAQTSCLSWKSSKKCRIKGAEMMEAMADKPEPVILTERRGPALWIIINRENRRNAINLDVIAGIKVPDVATLVAKLKNEAKVI